MPRRTTRLMISIAAIALAASACSDSAPAAEGVTVVATTTMLGDVAANVVGADGTVDVLIPVGVDPHDYQPSARQIAALQRADLVIVNGLLLEEGLLDVLESIAADGANVLEIAPQLNPIPFGALGADADDPHVWLDPIRMADGAGIVAAALAAVEPGVDWSARAGAYAEQLHDADDQVAELLSVVSEPNRKLVTNHDSLGYFAARYGFEVVGTVIPGGATLAEPSAAELAGLVAEIERQGVSAIFAETTEPALLSEAVAAEVGDDVAVVQLFTGSLGSPGSGADTLIGMLVTNAERIAQALR